MYTSAGLMPMANTNEEKRKRNKQKNNTKKYFLGISIFMHFPYTTVATAVIVDSRTPVYESEGTLT
jgi:hypothetical protein